MREKELRLALVLFGGVSLAIYQHGINREVLNLLRASRAYHEAHDPIAKQAPERDYAIACGERVDADALTAAVYFDLLKRIGRTLELRVLADVISGSSAGAINGIALARAIAHDLNLAPVTTLWLEQADMQRLIAPEARAKKWDKWYFRPLLRPALAWMRREGMLPSAADREMAERVLTFVRSRWFSPPLDGTMLSTVLLDGLLAMEAPPDRPPRSLLPAGTRLSLAVTVTDYHGIEKTVFIHDPPMLREREHRHHLRFRCEHHVSGALVSDFALANAPSLAFATRASASYPGAFPPARIRDMDELLAARGILWPGRTRFLERNFAHYREQGMNPEDVALLDGSVLDNKPITAAVHHVRQHRAFREVDRRLIFIDPHADPHKGDAAAGGSPGWFEILRGALSDLPRQQPVHHELAEIAHHNRQIRRLKEVIAQTRPQVAALVEEATGGALDAPITVAQLRHWRLTSTNQMASAPVVYNAWWRALVLEAIDYLVGLLGELCHYPRESSAMRWLQQVVEAWAVRNQVLRAEYHVASDVREDADMPAFAQMVIRFGIEYKRRRINFVLHELNDLYHQLEHEPDCATPAVRLDAVKREIHTCLEALGVYDDCSFVDAATAAEARALLRPGNGQPGLPPPLQAETFAAANDAALGRLIERIGAHSGIGKANAGMDAALASARVREIEPACRRKLLTAYLGYFHWDAILRPALDALALSAGPLEEVLVDRISPADAASLASVGAGRAALFGTAFGSFGGFLSRMARENDYLWGRLHAADRLVGIVASTVPDEAGLTPAELAAFRKRLFEAILAEESARLHAVPDLLERVRRAVAAL